MGKSRDKRRYEDGEEDVIEKFMERRGKRVKKESEIVDDKLSRRSDYDTRYDD